MQAEMLLAIPHGQAAPIRERVLAVSLQFPTGQSLMFCLVDSESLEQTSKVMMGIFGSLILRRESFESHPRKTVEVQSLNR